jgi:Tfp pilus assembly protein PilV
MGRHFSRGRLAPRRLERAPSRRRSGGFTLVEVIVAMILLTAGVLALAGTTALMVRQMTLSQMSTQRAAALQSAIERLRGLDWEAVDNGSATHGAYSLKWWIDEDLTQSRVMKVVTVGPGIQTGAGGPTLRPEVADTFTYRLLRY